MEQTEIKSVLERHKVKRADIASRLGVDKATVTRWFQGKFPAERAVEVERVIGIPRHELRPDIFEIVELTAAVESPSRAKVQS